MTILAEVSSGRSELLSSAPTVLRWNRPRTGPRQQTPSVPQHQCRSPHGELAGSTFTRHRITGIDRGRSIRIDNTEISKSAAVQQGGAGITFCRPCRGEWLYWRRRWGVLQDRWHILPGAAALCSRWPRGADPPAMAGNIASICCASVFGGAYRLSCSATRMPWMTLLQLQFRNQLGDVKRLTPASRASSSTRRSSAADRPRDRRARPDQSPSFSLS